MTTETYNDFMAPQSALRITDLRRDRPHGGRGYLVVDNRANGGGMFEANTFTCAHCGSVVIIHPAQKFAHCPAPACKNGCLGARKSARPTCKKCNAIVCDDRICIEECNSVERSIDKMMAKPLVQIPWLPRGYNGELLFDRSLLEAGKVY